LRCSRRRDMVADPPPPKRKLIVALSPSTPYE
jgi:hypothetical protein